MTVLTEIHWLLLLLAAPFVGSFLGLLIVRLPAGEPVMAGRSRCPACGRTLAVRDLVPILNWLSHRGRCRQCGAAISQLYPAVELAALAIAVWSLAVLPGWLAWAGAAFGWMLLTLAVIDARHFLLPDALTLPLAPAGLAVAWFVYPGALADHAIGGLAATAGLALIAWLYRRLRNRDGLGWGDVKLFGALGCWTAWQGLPTILLYAALAGLLWVVALRLTGRHLTATTHLPFGPFLCWAGWLVWLYGPVMLG